MKTKIIYFALFTFFFANSMLAQTKTTVNASNSEISYNLDLKAIASIFGDVNNLEDFETRLNDTKLKISNLDLNNDNEVDYLRVIESVEDKTHLIIIQAVLEKDVFQDVATIEVEKDAKNQTQVQIVGDVYVYGTNYIYEPVYVRTPSIFSYLWVSNYSPYRSVWNWRFYPRFYSYWNPFPIYKYRKNIRNCINFNNTYNYSNVRRSSVAVNLHLNLRANSYEAQNPERSFIRRNSLETKNRHELELNRTINSRTKTSNYSTISIRKSDREETVTSRSNRNLNENTRKNLVQTENIRENKKTDPISRNKISKENKKILNERRQ